MSGMRYCIAGLVCLSPLIGLPAHAIQCGDVITANTVLTADLGPCPGNALIIGAPGITLDLNGYRVTGMGAGSGVSLSDHPDSASATIQGPGVIANFGAGVAVSFGADNVTVKRVTFQGNGIGVIISRSDNDLIIDNDLRNGGIGIRISESTKITIQENRIIGHSGPGVFNAALAGPSVIGNTINENQVGITSFIEPGPMTIRGNTVSRNRENGIEFMACTIVAENTASHNGGSGIVNVAGRFQLPCPIQDNTASQNAVYGIAILGGSGFRITDNHAMQNQVDLFDGAGGNCWGDNKFKTSQPAVLPACQ